MLELALEFFELTVDAFVVSCEGFIDIFELLVFLLVLFAQVQIPGIQH